MAPYDVLVDPHTLPNLPKKDQHEEKTPEPTDGTEIENEVCNWKTIRLIQSIAKEKRHLHLLSTVTCLDARFTLSRRPRQFIAIVRLMRFFALKMTCVERKIGVF